MMKKLSLLVVAGAILVGGGLASQGNDPASAGSTWSRPAGVPISSSAVYPGK